MAHTNELIDNLVEFLGAHKTNLTLLKILFLANTDVHALLMQPTNAEQFFEQLTHCDNLESINLSFCQLQDADLNLQIKSTNLTSALQQVPQLRTVTLRNNSLSIMAIQEFERSINQSHPELAVIAEGAKSCPKPFTYKQQNWIPTYNWTKQEFLEMIEVAETIGYKQPALKKIHAYRAENEPKSNLQAANQNQSSTLPISAVLINGRAFLLPKYNSAPPAIHAYNGNADNRKPDFTKKIALLIHKPYTFTTEQDKLDVSAAKIYARSYRIHTMENPMETEIHNLFRRGDFPLGLRRGYAAGNPTNLMRKRYLVTEYIPGPDCFQHIELMFNIFNTLDRDYKQITMLDNALKIENVRFCLAFGLEAMSLHFIGINHGDLKPDNWINASANVYEAIDLGLSVTHDKLNSTEMFRASGTAGYLAPEAIGTEKHRQTSQIDAYAYGITIRQALYPVATSTGRFLNYISLSDNKNGISLLSAHFQSGIEANYSKQVAHIVSSLTEYNPNSRASISEAFCQLANLYPQIAQEVFDEKLSKLKDSINQTLATFKQARTLIDDTFKNWNVTPEGYSIGRHNQQNILLNYYCKLLTLNFCLKLFNYCNGQLPISTYEILEQSICELQKKDNPNCTKLCSIYYTNENLEKYMLFHFKILENMLNSFTDLATVMRESDEPVIADLLSTLQADIRKMWASKSSIIQIGEFILSAHKEVFVTSEKSAIMPQFNRAIDNFIEAIQTKIIGVQSPKLPRLSIS